MDDLEFLKSDAEKAAPPSSPIRGPIGLILLAGVVVATVIFGLQLYNEKQTQPRTGPAPEFQLQTMDGQEISLSDLRGQVVLINFWGSWCGPCHGEALDLQMIWEEYEDQDFLMLGVIYLDTENDAQEFINTYGLTFPNGLDIRSEISRMYHIQGAPESFIIDQNGDIAEFILGPINPQNVRRTLDALLTEASA